MAEVNETLSKKRTSNNNSGSVPLTDILYMTLHHWPWLLLSVAVCVGAAYFYLLRTPNVYTRAAEIMIKDDTKGNSGAGSEFSNMGLFQNKTNIQNEMINLRSQDLMEEVVRRLNLDINYFIDGKFHDVVAYGYDLPVRLALDGYPAEGSFSLNLAVSPSGEVKLTDLVMPGHEKSSATYTGHLGDSIATPLGNVCVTPTLTYHDGEKVELIVSKIPLSAARASYNARLSVTISNEQASVIRLTMSDQSPQRADDVLANLINVYNENWIQDRNQVAVSTSNFINDRLNVIESELGNVDSDISSYKSANLIPDVNAAASMYMSQNQQNEAAMFELNNQLNLASLVKSRLQSDKNIYELLPANSGISSSNINTLISEYNDIVTQRNQIATKSSDKNPIVRQLDDQLKALRSAMIKTIDTQISDLNAQMASLRSNEVKTIAKIQSNPDQARNLLSVERQQKVKESLYLFLLQKREENELSQAFTAYNTRMVNKPGASGIPTTPDRRNILLMAFLVGLAIPFGTIFARETFNTKVRGRKDVENLPLPFLGEIPQYVSKKKAAVDTKTTFVVKAGKRDIINEAFRVLRTNLEFMKVHRDSADVVAITSFNPGSGKSFLTMNLAKALALKNKRVLVIDGDMRHGSSSAYVGSPETGLSEILNGDVTDPASVIITDPDHPTLSIIPIGAVPPNPTELLESPIFKQMIDHFRHTYDYIIIDCPPIEVVADAQIIDKEADRTIFVLRAGLLERSMLPQLEKIYDDKKYTNMAFILNGTRNDQGRYGYSHSYRYGYGYGYGYGYNYGTKSK